MGCWRQKSDMQYSPGLMTTWLLFTSSKHRDLQWLQPADRVPRTMCKVWWREAGGAKDQLGPCWLQWITTANGSPAGSAQLSGTGFPRQSSPSTVVISGRGCTVSTLHLLYFQWKRRGKSSNSKVFIPTLSQTSFWFRKVGFPFPFG